MTSVSLREQLSAFIPDPRTVTVLLNEYFNTVRDNPGVSYSAGAFIQMVKGRG